MTSQLLILSQFLDKKTYEKVKAICNEYEINVETFVTHLLAQALNRHKKEVEQIIKNLKKVK